MEAAIAVFDGMFLVFTASRAFFDANLAKANYEMKGLYIVKFFFEIGFLRHCHDTDDFRPAAPAAAVDEHQQ